SVGSTVAAVIRTMFAEKPNAARAELDRVARAVFLVCHDAHLLRVLLSGKPGAVQIAEAVAAKYPSWQRRLWRGKMTVVRNGIDLSRFHPGDRVAARTRLGLAPEAVVLGIVGTICERKGHDRLLAAFAAARAECPGLTLVVVGTPEAESMDFAARLRAGADADVHWLGRRDDISEILPALDFLVSPSRHEGMGRVNVEAMACALPVIGADGTGIAEVVRAGETGLMVDAGDPAALTAAILKLARDPDLRRRMGQAGLQRARHLFEVERQTGQVLTDLRNLARGRP
ncbi:MAG: glycosyltransferase family 4 protein, partial [Pararhodobacter sp.]